MLMTGNPCGKTSRGRVGFTLIELLVVVAIIALLISILLPSLGQARAQARTTLCGTRMSQMTKGILLYADDYNETPPFIILGAGDDAPKYSDNWRDPNNRRKETWLASADTMERIFNLPETDWYSTGVPRLPESGSLFSYIRFAATYRCPEFERTTSADKDQNTFNYTRNVLGRKVDVDALINTLKRHYLDIIKISAMYNGSDMILMADEAWDGYVAWPEDYTWTWGGHDPVLDIFDSWMGSYHGTPIVGWGRYGDTKPGTEDGVLNNVPFKQATVGHYDGHVSLVRDPIPNVEHYGGRATLNPFASYFPMYYKWIAQLLYAQQGLAVPNLPF